MLTNYGMQKKSLNDTAVIEAIRLGSEKVLFALYDEMKSEFVSWVLANHKVSREDAKDIFQDAIIDFHSNVRDGKFRGNGASIRTYLFAIGKNKVYSFLKHSGRMTFEVADIQSVREDDEDTNKVAIIKRAIDEMGEACRKVLLMFYERNFSMDDIATSMGYASANVAKKKKHICLKKLEIRSKELLERYG